MCNYKGLGCCNLIIAGLDVAHASEGSETSAWFWLSGKENKIDTYTYIHIHLQVCILSQHNTPNIRFLMIMIPQ